MKQKLQSAFVDWFFLWFIMIMLGSSWAAELATNYAKAQSNWLSCATGTNEYDSTNMIYRTVVM